MEEIYGSNGSKELVAVWIQFFGDDTGADLNRRFNNNDRQGLYSTEYVLGVLGVAWDGWGAEGTELHTVQLYLLGGVCGNDKF